VPFVPLCLGGKLRVRGFGFWLLASDLVLRSRLQLLTSVGGSCRPPNRCAKHVAKYGQRHRQVFHEPRRASRQQSCPSLNPELHRKLHQKLLAALRLPSLAELLPPSLRSFLGSLLASILADKLQSFGASSRAEFCLQKPPTRRPLGCPLPGGIVVRAPSHTIRCGHRGAGSWFSIRGSRSSVLGPWFLVLGPRSSVFSLLSSLRIHPSSLIVLLTPHSSLLPPHSPLIVHHSSFSSFLRLQCPPPAILHFDICILQFDFVPSPSLPFGF